MMKNGRFASRALSLLLVVACAGVLTGCARAPAPAQPGSSPATPTPAPKAPVVLRRAFSYGGDPGNLDPLLATRIDQMTVITSIFDTLIFLNAYTGQFEPRLAKEWRLSEDGLTYSFTLNPGVKFHHGRELLAEDVKHTIERLVNPANASPNAGRYHDIVGAKEFAADQAPGISGINVKGKYELEIHLTRYNPLFLYTLAHTSASIIPKEETDRLKEAFGHQPVGSGPFVFVSWKKDDRVVVKANEDWFMGRPSIDGIETRILPEAATKEAEFLAGNLDYIVLSGAQYKKYSADPKWKEHLVEVAELFTRHFCFNVEKPPLDKVEVRQAINYAIDRAAIIKNVLHDKAVLATGILPPSLPAYNPALKGYEYNPQKAQELLARAGYPNGFEVEIICTDNPAWGLPAVEAAMGYLSQVGIRLKPVLMDATSMVDITNRGDYYIHSYSRGGNASSLDYIYSRFHSKFVEGLGNTARYQNPEVDALLDQAMAERDLERQMELIRRAEETIVRDAPWMFFNYNKAVVLKQPWLKGMLAIPTDIDLQHWHTLQLDR